MPGNASNLFDDTQIKKASQAALELQQHLSKAVNVDTGKLDLSRFSSSLKTSNKDLSIYCNTLLSTGEKGQQAFLQLAQAIATADTPVTRVNKKLAEMGTTLKNTARWQISSSILHGFMGAVQSAYGYAQDLNESLNEIRIVTGQNIEQMSKFAAEANRAAKALSTTTTEYTDASLIYYQQGLSDSEVAKRTEVTIKMANAAGQSAQIVSDQLTAIWNNFYDGSKSLEYYADVMTALGAATASSTDEIAGGLEKFAAIGETIGLSYEYAASALATITSNTRQSEEVVGTALKTIFARIQGLNLGETLDDGTTLNKYSKALQSVGISIFDQAGELKNMDNILNEMANKWDTLSKAQQVALAQTVAGTRQYTQLVALMDNWDNGDNDSMTANLNTAYGSSGALQEQADIYAESWEAAQDRVTAAAEHIYSSLINDEFFIDLLNGFEKVLETVGGLIDGLGGLKGVVGIVGSVFLTNFAKKMPEALDNLRQNVMVFTGQANKEMQKVQSDLSMSIKTAQATPGASTEYKIQLEGIAQVNAMKQKLTLASKNLTSQEIAEYEAKIDNVKAMYDEVAALSAKAEALKKVEDAAAKQAMKTASKGADSLFGDYQAARDNRNRAEERATAPGASAEETTAYVQEMAKAQTQVDALEQKIKSLAEAAQLTEHEMRALMAGPEVTKGNAQATENAAKGQEKIKKAIAETTAELQKQSKQRSYLNNLSVSIKSQAASWRDVSKEVSTAVKEHKNLKGAEKTTNTLKEKMTQYLEVLKRVAKESDLALDDDYIEKMAQSINNMDTSNIEDVTAEFDDFATAISTDASNGVKQLDGSISTLSEKMGALQFDSGEIDGLEQKADEAAEGLQNLNNSMDNIQGTAEETFGGEFKPSVALTEFASVAMSVSSLVTSMQSAMSVFADEGATGFEKIGAAISVLMPLMSTFNALQALSTTLSNKDTIAKAANALGMKVMAAIAPATVTAKTAETGAVWANTAAWYANPIMWIALIIVGVVAALAALVTIIVKVSQALSDAYNKDAIAAEKAEASARALSEAYNEAKQSYEDMIAAMDEYKSARESLDSLTEGTKEYQEALEQANRAALELINNNPDLFKAGDYHWENGELIINDDAMTRAQQAASARESQAYAAMQMGQAEAKEARNVADETALRRELVKDSTTGSDYLVGALTGAFSSAALGTVIATALGGPIGLAIGGALMSAKALGGAALGGAAMTGTLESKKLEESGALDKTLAQLKKDSSFLDSGADNIKATLNIEDDDIINALIENKDALLELSQAQEAQAQQEKLAAQQSAMEIMQNHGIDNADEMAYSAGAVFQKANEAAYEQMLETMSSKGGLKAGAAAYFDSQGISSKDGFKVEKYDAKNGTVKYSYLDEQGQRQEMEVTAEQIAMTQAVVAAEAELLDKCKTISGAFDALDADIKQVGSSTATLSEGMKAFLSSGDTSQLTKEQYDAMAGMSSDEMRNYLASIGINDTNAQDFGYDDVAALIADMDLANTGDKWAEYQNITAHQGTENLTLDQAENINNALKDVADFFGEEVGHEMLDLSAAMADSLDEAAQDDFWQQLGNISDYTDADQWDAFLEAMKESEDMTDEQIKALEDYVNTAKLAAKATKELNFDEMAESVRSLRDIMKNISEGNREISDEEFAALEAQGIDTSKFAKTIDGYRYLGDSADLVADISEGITNQFKEAEQNFANIAATAQQASQNLIDAEAELAAAKAAGDRTRASAEAGAQNQMSNTEKLSVIMSNIVTNVVSKIKTAWDWICGVMMDVYDFFVNVFNTIGQGITDVWNGFLQAISDIINGSIGAIMEWIEDTFDIDTGWDDIEFEKAEFTAAKTPEEQLAEENAKKAEEDLIASTQALADAIPDMVASIESSADYLSEAELEAGRVEASQNHNAAMADYDAAVATYGADSTQAKYYEQLVVYYEAQMDAYAKALDSKAWGEVIAEGIDTKEMESYIDLLEQAHPEMRKLYETTEDYENALLQVATANKKMEKGVKSLSSNWDNWNDIMSDSEASASDIATILPDVNDALQDVLNLDTAEFAMLPPDFAQKHWDLIQDVVNGVEGSVDTLRDMAGQEILMQIDGVVDPDGNIDAQFLALHEKIASFDQSQFTVGVAIDPEANADFIAACNDIIQKAGMTAEQAQAYFASMGYDITLKPVKKQISETVWNHKYRNLYDEKGNPSGKVIEKAWPSTFTGEVEALAIETITPNGSYGGGIGVETTPPKTSTVKPDSSGGGGSTSTPEEGEKTKKSDTVERYKEVTDILSKVGREMQKLADAEDELWGKDKLNNIQDQIDMIDEETEALKRQRDEAEAYMNEDATDVQQAASKLGLSFTIEDGYITNYEDVMADAHQQLSEAEAKYNSYYEQSLDPSLTDEQKNQLAEDQAAYEETVLQPLRDNIADLQDALGLYDESAQKFRDSEDAIEENERKKRALQYQKWTEQLELEIGFDEDDIEVFEHLISVLGDNFYKMAEALAYMSGSLEQLQNGEFGGQMKGYLNQLETYNQRYKELESLKAQNKISDADYIAGLEEIKAGMMNNVAAIAEMDSAMVNYYGDTLDAAMDELSAYTDMIEHSSTVLDHYTSILETLGKSTDYKKMGAILKGQASVAKNQADVSAAWYESRKKDAEEQARIYQEQKDLYDQGLISEDVLKGYEQKWIDAQTAANEAQDQMLSDAAAWAEALRAVVENELADLGQTLENQLTQGYGSFDNMMTAMERASSLQEEYLTTTNQIYETNKMMRTAQQEIDKTSNSVAKRRLKQFMEETSALQNQTKLSQYELDIQQAKYDLLLAEIALEEAQQAKSTVRLQRDSEGNFGYVYTADQNQVSEAQQQLEDAQNSLYNIGLEGANEYSQKYAETMQEMYDTLTSIQEAWLNGEFETQAEYNQAMADAQEYYYQKLQDYSSLYQVAITTDSRVVRDAWSTDFADMTYNTAQWKASVSTYVTGVANAFQQWQTDIAGIESLVGKSLTEIETNVGNITTNSQALADTTTNSVIPALDKEISSVHNLTDEYLGLRKSILDVINEYNLMINTINGVPKSKYENQDDVDDGSGGDDSGGGNGDAAGSGDGSGGNGTSGTGGSGDTGSSGDGTDGEDELTWDRIMEAYDHIVSGDWGNGVEHRVKEGIAAGFTEAEVRAAQQYINYTFPKHLNGMGYSKAKAKELLGFDTGGYTGEWGPYGKLAVLHEKELVLNQQQTADLLSTMEFLDKILQTLDLQALSSQVGGLLSSPYFGQSVGETLEQNVHIEASFPGVQDRNEIEEAFNTLINQASQYANRK